MKFCSDSNVLHVNYITSFVPQVAKQHGSQNASKQVAYLWAKSLGKLKLKLSYLILVAIIIVFVKFKSMIFQFGSLASHEDLVLMVRNK